MAQLAPGDVVTTLKNTVDKVVTEWGVAELLGRSIRDRAVALIAIANPDHRDRLRFEAEQVGSCDERLADEITRGDRPVDAGLRQTITAKACNPMDVAERHVRTNRDVRLWAP